MDKKRTMRHTDEIHAILTAIYCINETTAKDEDVAKLIEYAFYRVYKEGVYKSERALRAKTKVGRDARPVTVIRIRNGNEFKIILAFFSI